VDTGSDF